MSSIPLTSQPAPATVPSDGRAAKVESGNIVRARLNLTGIKAILWHHFGPDAIPLEAIERTGVAGNDPEEWRKTYLASPEGQLYVKDTYIFTCLRDAATFVKRGLNRKVSATLQVEDERIFFDRWMPDEDLSLQKFRNAYTLPVYLDVQSTVNKSTKSRNVRYRVAASPGWRATCTIAWDKTMVSRPLMEAIVREAGKLVGIGDGRNIGKGRFVVEFTMLEDGHA